MVVVGGEDVGGVIGEGGWRRERVVIVVVEGKGGVVVREEEVGVGVREVVGVEVGSGGDDGLEELEWRVWGV
ncbi:hypothetical protein, partial [Micrococcus luteus]|uniref:hypothetical protein n=1 Tax=Micrococcus luteus TaxID=1270 RepID=UPI0011A58BFB